MKIKSKDGRTVIIKNDRWFICEAWDMGELQRFIYKKIRRLPSHNNLRKMIFRELMDNCM